ncbi:MAG: 50S ribosomal protein L29 [Candidatus Kerfeldbacteria bacterium]|nr:50S ribosomal protein L29 [Candidatus Kerfeldbacteria bacterium]
MKIRDQRNELKSKGVPELQKLLLSSREEHRDLRFRISAKQHKDIRDLREVRHRIARILTLLKSRRGRQASVSQRTPT